MPQIHKSRNAIWRVWSGPLTMGGKGKKKRVGVTVAISIRSDKLPDFLEDQFVKEVSEMLVKRASGYDPQ